MMIGYVRSAPGEYGRASLREYAYTNDLALETIFEDERGSFRDLRGLHSLSKVGLLTTLFVRDIRDLGDDEYMALESRLFFERNGVKLIFAKKPRRDLRHDIALNVFRYFGNITETDVGYGLMLPLRSTRRVFSRKPPFGYTVTDGAPRVCESEAYAVRRIFESYIAGRRIRDIVSEVSSLDNGFCRSFSNMTIKTILRNERYLGRLSQKGYHLPSIISFDTWLAAHERLEREYPPSRDAEPYLKPIRRIGEVVFYRSSDPDGKRHAESLPNNVIKVDSDLLEAAAEKLIASFCTQENAASFYQNYVLPQRDKSQRARAQYSAEYNRTLSAFESKLRSLIAGERTEEEQAELEELTDRKNVFGMRQRRIDSENRLYSITEEQVHSFFGRSSRMGELSVEECAFIASTFIRSVCIERERITMFYVSPADGKLRKAILE